jgi:hypothetical protein
MKEEDQRATIQLKLADNITVQHLDPYEAFWFLAEQEKPMLQHAMALT